MLHVAENFEIDTALTNRDETANIKDDDVVSVIKDDVVSANQDDTAPLQNREDLAQSSKDSNNDYLKMVFLERKTWTWTLLAILK